MTEDPGNGYFRYNSDVLGNIEYLSIDNLTFEGTNLRQFILTWDASNSDDDTNLTTRGHLVIQGSLPESTTYTIFKIVGDSTANNGWVKLKIDYEEGVSPVSEEL